MLSVVPESHERPVGCSPCHLRFEWGRAELTSPRLGHLDPKLERSAWVAIMHTGDSYAWIVAVLFDACTYASTPRVVRCTVRDA